MCAIDYRIKYIPNNVYSVDCNAYTNNQFIEKLLYYNNLIYLNLGTAIRIYFRNSVKGRFKTQHHVINYYNKKIK